MALLFDNHSHSRFSPDGKMTIDEALSTAVENGLGGIAVTDHFDFDAPKGVMLFQFDPDRQQKAISESLKNKRVPDGFKLLRGVEIGVQPQSIDKIKKLISGYSFDTVIASLHFIDGTDPYHGAYYGPYDYKRGYGHYLETFYECISMFEDFDILGHFDYIARYAPYKETDILYSDFSDIIDAILKKLAGEGKTFEINTKTYHLFGNREPHLDMAILKRWKELGGEFVSLGSDAHETKRIGENFSKFTPMLLEAGIRYTVYFEDRKAHPVSIL